MFGKNREIIKRGLAAALSAGLFAGAITVSAALPSAAATSSRVETDSKGSVTIRLDGREVWQAASDAMQKAEVVTGDTAVRIMSQTGPNGDPVVLEDNIYQMELPEKAWKGLPAGLGVKMYISASIDDAAEDYTASEKEEAEASDATAASASELAAADGAEERPVKEFFASGMFSLIKENDAYAPAEGAAAAGGEGYELDGSEHIYFVLTNATDRDVNYTVKLGGMEILKTKVLRSHGDTAGVVSASVSDLVGLPASASGMVRATGSDIDHKSGKRAAELTDDVVAKVVRTTLKNFFVIYHSAETALGTKVMVVTTADTKFRSENAGLLSGRSNKPVLHAEDVLKGTEKYDDAAKTLRENNVEHADFAAVDISFRRSASGTEIYEPYGGRIVNVRIESRAMEGFDPDSISIQHHLEDGTVETVAGTAKNTVIESESTEYAGFRMKLESGETALINNLESGAGSSGIMTEVKEEKDKGSVRVEDGRVIADFAVDSFSLYSISVSEKPVPDTDYKAEPMRRQIVIPAREGSILDGFVSDDANEWQIVAEEYTNNDAANKTNYGNDPYRAVRVQKNVIPAGTENEFYVYLSIDTKQLLREWIMNAEYHKAAQNNWHPAPGISIGDIVDAMPSFQSGFTANPDSGFPLYTYVDVIDQHGNLLLKSVAIYSDHSENNATVFLDISPYGYVLFGQSVRKGVSAANSSQNRCVISDDAIAVIEQFILETFSLETVTDVMGGDIEFLEVVSGDYTETPVCEDGVLTWKPEMKTNPLVAETGSGLNSERWFMNTAELLYKVRLDVTADGFHSCADNMNSTIGEPESYPVNESASVNYTVSVGSSTVPGTAVFQKPYVRGMQYDIKVKKIDQDGNPLPGVQFALTGTSAASAVSDAEGYVTITKLPWGTYTLTETPPAGYSSEKLSYTAELCYTTNKANLSESVIDKSRMMPAEWKPYLTITNKRIITNLTVQKIVSGSMGNKAGTFTFTVELFDHADAALTRPLIGAGITVSDNVTDNQDGTWTVTLGDKDIAEFRDIPAGTYFKVTETDVPADYKTTYRVNGGNPSTDPAQGATTAAGTTTVVVENSRNMTIPTGVRTDLNFWSLITGACFLILSGSFIYSRRRSQ